jgi:hypothetical protein
MIRILFTLVFFAAHASLFSAQKVFSRFKYEEIKKKLTSPKAASSTSTQDVNKEAKTIKPNQDVLRSKDVQTYESYIASQIELEDDIESQ